MDFSQLCIYAEAIGQSKKTELKSEAIKTVYSLYRNRKLSFGEKKILESLIKPCYTIVRADKR